MYQNEFQSWGGQRATAAAHVGAALETAAEGCQIAHGLGRAYGDAALPYAATDSVLLTTYGDRIRSFDRDSGVLRAQAGLSIADINNSFLARGWFMPVSPGTQFVTLGGAVAADIHGKNHHVAGSIGQHVRSLKMMTARGLIDCSPSKHADLFWATVGGMGLTGHILEVELTMKRLPSPWIIETARKVVDVEDFIEQLVDVANTSPMTMGWIDCLAKGRQLGRGILMMGRWANADEAPASPPRYRAKASMPIYAPNFALNGLTVRAFNEVFYRMRKTGTDRLTNPYDFFYPLDAVRTWNRMYGKQGLTQYQCVIPRAAGARPLAAILEAVAGENAASFLCVIKDFGPAGDGLLSFPRAGTTLAIDLPNKPNAATLTHTLNRITRDAGGRVYLAKDLFTKREDFEAMEGARLTAFQEVREKWGARGRFRSALSRRLLGE